MVSAATGLLLTALIAAGSVLAAEPRHFVIDNENSHIRYEAIQNNVSVTGAFTRFDGTVAFHPDALAESHARIEVDITSVTADYDEVISTLKTAEWFDAENHPKAVFETAGFTALGDNHYEAKATLTMKGHQQPATLTFTLEEFNDESARITGETALKRTSYGIGWSDTGTVRDGVTVSVTVTAKTADGKIE